MANKKNRRRLTIGDIHGHLHSFIDIYDMEEPDDVVLLGDYFDSFSMSDEEIEDCFESIIGLQNSHKKGDFIMLIGNHDFHYMVDGERYSGYRHSIAPYIHMKLNDMMHDKRMKFVHADLKNRIVFSHAGITNTWLANNKMSGITDLNDANMANINAFRFTGSDIYGNDVRNGPLWVRPDALLYDIYEDADGYTWTQVVGHTHMRQPLFIKHDGTKCYGIQENRQYRGHRVQGRDDDLTIVYCMDTMPEYYMLETLNEDGIVTERLVKHYIPEDEEL